MTVSFQPFSSGFGRPFAALGPTRVVVELLAVDQLEKYVMHVHRMGVTGEIVKRPNFRIAGRRILGNWIAPMVRRNPLRPPRCWVERPKRRLVRDFMTFCRRRCRFDEGERTLSSPGKHSDGRHDELRRRRGRIGTRRSAIDTKLHHLAGCA